EQVLKQKFNTKVMINAKSGKYYAIFLQLLAFVPSVVPPQTGKPADTQERQPLGGMTQMTCQE
ncbi:MAG: hypothetical protein MR627_05070, partial [Prevotella sp.]|nr:hypothetical protein [Prevotella sp.]